MPLIRSLLAITFLIAGCATDSLVFDQREITQGAYRGIEIGTSKEGVTAVLMELGVQRVRVLPNAKFLVNSANISELSLVAASEGIRLMNYRGLSIDLVFENGAVVAIGKSVPAKDLSWFHEGESVGEVIGGLRRLLSDDPGLVVIPIVRPPQLPGAVADLASTSDVAQLRRHDTWGVELPDESPRGAFIELRFQGNRLGRIGYRRARISLE